MIFPPISQANRIQANGRRIFVGAYGFEQRSLGWCKYQEDQGGILNQAVLIRYMNPKGRNRIHELRELLTKLGVTTPMEIRYNNRSPRNIDDILSHKLEQTLLGFDEVVVDISAMTKLLILVCLCTISKFKGTVRIVYSEARDYSPTKDEYEKSKGDMKMIANFPSRGSESIIRLKCLSSIRMQGQPVTMVAFTSFNEQLVRHMLGTINPHRLLFINGQPPSLEYTWREYAMQEIHKRLIDEYQADNPIGNTGLLTRVSSTLVYSESIEQLNEIHERYGTHERIICAATGSKMQTVGLFFGKILHPDIHVEYPTPDSYFVKRMSVGVRNVHEVVIPCFSEFLQQIRQ